MTSELFAKLAEELTGSQPGVEPTRMFGSAGLKSHGKTFAMLVRGRLVVKLPRGRVQELLAAGAGDRLDPGHGRVMREWKCRGAFWKRTVVAWLGSIRCWLSTTSPAARNSPSIRKPP
jgi:TfoX/Sxy family transcriptional regulator of competence genes